MNTIKIRQATPEDAPLIALGLVHAIGEAHCKKMAGSKHSVEYVKSLFEQMARRDDTQYSYLNTRIAVDENGTSLGVCVSYDGGRLQELRKPFLDIAIPCLDLKLPIEDETDASEFYLDTLYVLPEARKRGVGRALINDAAGRAALTRKPLGLLVDPDNLPAQRLYFASGFHKIAPRPFFGIPMLHLYRPTEIGKRVRVSIVTYQTDTEELSTVVKDLQKGGLNQICIVDNSPNDRLRDLCNSLSVDYLFMGRNAGYGAAHNVAIKKSLSDPTIDYHLVINSDVRVPTETPGLILNYMDQHPDVGQLSPRINNPDGTVQSTVRLLPTPLDVFGRRFLPARIMARRNQKYTLSFRNPDLEVNVPYHQGSFMWLRVSALRKIGLFDERFFMYPEDIDLTRRMHREYRTLFWPGAEVLHYHRAASYQSRRMLKIHIVNMIRYFNKWGWLFDRERRHFNRRLLSQLIPQNLGKEIDGD